MNAPKIGILLCGTALFVAPLTGCSQQKQKSPTAECRQYQTLSTGDTMYACSPDGKWVVDKAAMKAVADDDEAKKNLYWALRTRVLTDKEMEQVRQEGVDLLIHNGETFNDVEKEKELNDALVTQFRIRAIAAQTKTSQPSH
jgi:hypothetical protein